VGLLDGGGSGSRLRVQAVVVLAVCRCTHQQLGKRDAVPHHAVLDHLVHLVEAPQPQHDRDGARRRLEQVAQPVQVGVADVLQVHRHYKVCKFLAERVSA
jgi:hypothetical protein